MYKGYRIRIYPTKEQEIIIWKHINASRFIWNYMLELQEENYKNGVKYIGEFDMNRLVTKLKKQSDYTWLNEVSSVTLQRSCADLNFAYKRFFNGLGHPRFKSKKTSKKAYPTDCVHFYFIDGMVKICKLGLVKYKSDFNLPNGRQNKFQNVRVSYEDGKYMIAFSMEVDSQDYILNGSPMGIDLGVKELAVVAYRDTQYVFHNINKSKKMKNLNKRIKYLQRIISRKYEASKKNTGRYIKSNNIIKCEAKLKRLMRKVKNIRDNYIHHVTHDLVSMLPRKVVMEDLNVVGMMKNRHISKSVQEQCFYKFKQQMNYKCVWRGIEFVLADRFFPSSKTCSNCGAIKRDLKLSDRTYVCPECGCVIDRDYNAAINLSKYMA